MIQILQGDCLQKLGELPDASVHCCVTSPPYWGLRDYGVAGQIGLEKTPEDYVAVMVGVFREVRRVLRDDGTLWLNLGDSYVSIGHKKSNSGYGTTGLAGGIAQEHSPTHRENNGDGLKHKDLCGIPWRVAFALQADGWVLRQEIIWQKPNPMPESVRDRCTKSHEQIFMFAKAKWCGPDAGMFSHISDEDARWLALLLDTEGNICVKRSEREEDHRTWYGTQIAWANTSRELLEVAKSIVGKGSIHERPGKNSPVYYYQVSNQEARWLLHRIYPHFIIKARQARLGIYLQELLSPTGKKRPNGYRSDGHTAILEKAWVTMKSLNHFGNPEISWVPEPKYGRWDSQPYFYDAEAIKEPQAILPNGKLAAGTGARTSIKSESKSARAAMASEWTSGKDRDVGGRNKRDVWTVNSQPYPESHFATFPEDLIKPCILAGCPVGGTVLDPFGGSGTTGQVALELGRKAILIELNPKYIPLIERRTNVTPGLQLA